MAERKKMRTFAVELKLNSEKSGTNGEYICLVVALETRLVARHRAVVFNIEIKNGGSSRLRRVSVFLLSALKG